MPSRVEAGNASTEPCADDADKSVGKDKALVVGCYANNGNASARTANCNNAVSNGKSMAGEQIKLNKVEGATVYITDYTLRQNHKDSEYFVRFQFVAIDAEGNKRLYVTNNGSFEIKEFFELVRLGKEKLPIKTVIRSEGNSYYFEGFHTTTQEACELICEQLGI